MDEFVLCIKDQAYIAHSDDDDDSVILLSNLQNEGIFIIQNERNVQNERIVQNEPIVGNENIFNSITFVKIKDFAFFLN